MAKHWITLSAIAYGLLFHASAVFAGGWCYYDDSATRTPPPPLMNTTEPPTAQRAVQIDLSEGVHFDFNRASLKSAGKAALDQLLGDIAGLNPGYGMGRVGYMLGIDVLGHTDSIGSHRYNHRLGLRRARTIKNYLARRGLQRQRIKVGSLGERRPVASNRSRKGRALNRRVEIIVHTLQAP